MDIRNKRIVVVGLGRSGFDAAILAHKHGAIAAVTDSCSEEKITQDIDVLKENFIEVEFGQHTEEFLSGTDIIVLSPGVDNNSLPVKYAFANSIPIISEIEFAYNFCKGKIIAVTGTNGKSTVVTLLGKMFEKDSKKYIVCGNIGNSFSGEIDNIDDDTFVILEISSFQLEKIVDLKVNIGCILNVTDDHLERYTSFDDYADTKARLFENQIESDIALINHDDKASKDLIIPGRGKKFFYSVTEEVEGAFVLNNVMYSKIDDDVKKLFDIPKTKLKGKYNLENICASSFMAISAGVNIEAVISAIEDFQPLAHRLEKFYEKDGIVFMDDSKATNVDATKRAIQSLDKKIILIAGGRDKGGDYLSVLPEIKEKVYKIILIGEAADKIFDVMDKKNVPVEKAGSMEDAIDRAIKIAQKDQVILLSPMCSSFDMFTSYKHRGEVFQRIVKERFS
ncbi:MAG: UDP-N-acetylmuramoyl-L-alanine--D-glutamate ligase [Candidatus Omnitrophica bacterium]|nr:UDP-N-acetylmuramoyl-L-alanine--D-glutamate ligase [Candidatus Omnitrophota bacterium]